MATPDDVFETWSNKRPLTLDLAGLSEAERKEGSMFLGGSAARFVTPQDEYNPQEIGEVAFLWGDPEAESIFAILQEHDTRPASIHDQVFPFSAAALIGDQLWDLAVQRGTFGPAAAYGRPENFIEIPYHPQKGYEVLRSAFATGNFPLPHLIGRVGISWVMFEMGMTLQSYHQR